MTLIKDIFSPKSFMPVHVTHDGMELLEAVTDSSRVGGALFLEIGVRASTPYTIQVLLDDHFPDLLDIAIEEDCEYISFYI